MILIIILALLYILKLAEVGIMDNISWWWINGLAFLAFLWFEFIERALGLDKKQEDRMHDKMKQDRIKRTFKRK
ncbi:MAG: TIGR04438 family Trp-rich protein [Burkholderiaceae bacterium]|nr:MAG: TIGR04438 family Trp-rich protein [Burkholderiaceae bacterium]